MIYLDNAATTNNKPFCVKYAVIKAMGKNYSANPGRSSHNISIKSALEILKAREQLAKFFGLKNENNVIFTSGCTESLNLAILGSVKEKGHIITTVFEHNSVLRPLYYLKEKGLIDYTIVKPNFYGEITTKELKSALKTNTYMLIVNHISNVTGQENNLLEFGKFAKENNLLFLVDAAQSAGHKKICMQENNIDMLCVAGHKGLYSPQGVGVLLHNNIPLNPIKFGGTGIFAEEKNMPIISPETYEAGTTCTPNIFGLLAGVKFVKKHFSKIVKKQNIQTKYLLEKLNSLNNIILYTKPHSLNGVISLNIKNKTSQEVANILNAKHKICVRSGLHCAPLVHEFYGTLESGMVRVSLSYFTKKKELNKLINALKNI